MIFQVKKSLVDGGGEGLYAVRDIAKDEIVAFYNGVGRLGIRAIPKV